jgi:hypothetical protein
MVPASTNHLTVAGTVNYFVQLPAPRRDHLLAIRACRGYNSGFVFDINLVAGSLEWTL